MSLRIIARHCALLLLIAAAVACERPFSEDDSKRKEDKTATEDLVRLHVSAFSHTIVPFSQRALAPKRASAVGDACTRLSFAIYKEAERVVSENQVSSDKDFGTLDVSLEKGTYRIVVIGHNGTGSATTKDLNKITFPNNKTTDTFYSSQEIDLDGDTNLSIELRRIVAMFRLVVTDKIPSEVAKMQFYYTGGSSTLDGATGYGCVNSKQTEVREVTADMRNGNATFDIYTLPHSESGTLNITVTAYDSNDKAVKQSVFADVEVKVNTIHQYEGDFFSEEADDGRSKLTVTVDDSWSDIIYSKY